MLFHDPFAPLIGQLTRPAAFLPAADVAVGDGDVVLTMDVPGMTAESLEIELVDGDLVVRGMRTPPELPDGTRLTHVERAFGRFERRIRIPDGVDADAVTASLDNGVLSLIVPKPERLKRKAIAIETGTIDAQRQLETAAATT